MLLIATCTAKLADTQTHTVFFALCFAGCTVLCREADDCLGRRPDQPPLLRFS
jgi:hypothetical protein